MSLAEQLALPPAPAPPRPRTLMVATALCVAAGAMLFTGLLGIYLTLRASVGGTTADWVPEAASIPQVPANMALITLLMSSVTIQWVLYAMGRDDRRNAYLALGITTVLGLAQINGASFFISQLGVGVADSAYAVVTYAILGTHLALMGAAIAYLALTAFRALGGQFSAREREGLAAAALFWHFAVVAYAAVVAVVVWVK